MVKKIVTILIISICILSSATSEFAYAEKYWQKGANYSTKVANEYNPAYSYSSSSSVVVVSASATFDGVSTGKERVRAYSRCEVVKNITKANTCYVNEMSVRFAKINSSGTDLSNADNFVTLVTPRESSIRQYYSPISYLIGNYYVNAIAMTIETIINGMSYRVEHSIASRHNAARVIFENVDTEKVDVPTTVTYKEIESTYKKTAKGVGATFSFHDTSRSKFYVTAQADAEYTVSIPTGVPYQPPLVLTIKTTPAKITHTIGG